MPVPGFLSSFADKAQSALQSTPLGQHLPSGRASSPDSASQPSANQAAHGGTAGAAGHKSHAFEALSHGFRSLQQQYTYVHVDFSSANVS